jgi:MoaA/NifB/PqqE/SkfB family radical SAM enzyme
MSRGRYGRVPRRAKSPTNSLRRWVARASAVRHDGRRCVEGAARDTLDVMQPPPRADVKVGFACNNHCVFCAQGEKRSRCGAISLDELVTRLADVRGDRRTPRGLVLTGGEPMLHKNIVGLVRAAKALGFDPIQLQTNGRLLSYRNAIDAMIAAGVNELSPSIHGSTAAIHDALTCAAGSFEQSRAGIANAVATGLPVVTNSVVVKDNVEDLPALVTMLADLGVKLAQLAFVHPVGTAMEKFHEVVPRLPDVSRAVVVAREIADARGVRLVTEGVPLCFLRGMEHLAVEDQIPDTTVVELDGEVAAYSKWRTAEGKLHGPPCEGCSARARCEGPWREYPEAFGWAEFTAL